jgi:ABC-type transporter Mla MlaB component
MPTPGHETPARAMQLATPGEHLCSFPRTDAERRRIAAVFVRAGLTAARKVLYLSDHSSEAMLAILRGEGVDGVDDAHRSGQLLLMDFASRYGPRGVFSAESAEGDYRAAAAVARDEGYPGLHIAGEMDWFARGAVPLEELVAWERGCTALTADLGAVGLCQYDRALFGPAACAAVAPPHTGVAEDDGSSPMAVLTRGPAGRFSLAGEVDASNAAALARALRARLRTGESVELDVTGLEFADLAAVRVLRNCARDLAPGQRLVIRKAPEHVRRLLDLMGWGDLGARLEVL